MFSVHDWSGAGKKAKTAPESSNKANSSSWDNSRVRCFKCKQYGHMIKDCPKLLKNNKEKSSKSSSKNSKVSKHHKSMAKWKLQPPSDPKQTIIKNIGRHIISILNVETGHLLALLSYILDSSHQPTLNHHLPQLLQT